VFKEHNYDYIVNFEKQIDDELVPSSYANCNSIACVFDHTEVTEFKPDLMNENLNMAARQYLRDYYACGRIGERRGQTFEELVRRYYAYEVKDLEYYVFEMPTDNLNDFEELADAVFDYMWFQDNVPKHLFNHKES